jgi:hypothetical protein
MILARCAAALAAAAALAGCSLTPLPQHPTKLAPFPDGTADTTHGAVGVQTSPQ